jgi:hypothetical protein
MPEFQTEDGLIYVCPACFDGFHDMCFRKADTTGDRCECGINAHQYEPWLEDDMADSDSAPSAPEAER